MKRVQATIDRTAIGLSVVCVVHCLFIPIAVTLLPAFTATAFEGEQFHQLLLIGVLPTSLIGLTLGCRKHGSRKVMFTGLLGLSTLFLTAFLGHDLLGETGEKVATFFGAAIIAYGHFQNQTLCRKHRCHE